MNPTRRALLFLPLLLAAGGADAANVVRYPLLEPVGASEWYALAHRYSIKVLQAALARSGADFVLQPAEHSMPQGRMIEQARHSAGPDLLWTMTSAERERELEPIRIPLYKGLIGWRVLLVRRADLARFAAVRTLDDLQRLTALQGHDWPDAAILRANGLRVSTSANYYSMFEMLAQRRGDYFPRSVLEAWGELHTRPQLDLAVEPNILLRYPAALYFFVDRNNKRLIGALRAGMEALVADGTLDALFHRYHDTYLGRLDLAHRRIFELHNPLLPPATPLQRRELWLRPQA